MESGSDFQTLSDSWTQRMYIGKPFVDLPGIS